MRAAGLGLMLSFAFAGCGGADRAAVDSSAGATVSDAPYEAAPDSAARLALAELDPAIRQEIRYAGSNNFTGGPLPGYGRQLALLRREAAEALTRVQRRLEAEGLGLKVWDGYRPVRATLGMVEWCERVGRTDLLDNGYIARRSGHNRGTAIDLTLIELATGAELEMGTPYDDFVEAAHTANATGAVAANRAKLVQSMEAEGFANYEQEWWHFSFTVDQPEPYDLPLEQW